MMFSSEASLYAVTLKQYLYKLKGYAGLVYGLIISQVLALLTSLNGVGGMGGGSDDLSVSVKNYSAGTVIMFTFMWIFAIAIILTIKQYKNMDFTLVTNRVSGNLSNAAFLLTACVFGGVTSTLFSVLLRIIAYFSFGRANIILDGFSVTFSSLILGMAVNILYLVLFAAAGYFIGILTQINMTFAIIIPAVLLGSLRVNPPGYFLSVIYFFSKEISVPVLTLKIIVIAAVLFGLSILLSNGTEVKK